MNRPRVYILEDKVAVPVEMMEWIEWFTHLHSDKVFDKKARVGGDMVGKIHVSTVFLGIDSSFFEGPPILFETMVFGGLHDGWVNRYSTWEQAEAGHKVILEMVRRKDTWYIRLWLWFKEQKEKIRKWRNKKRDEQQP